MLFNEFQDAFVYMRIASEKHTKEAVLIYRIRHIALNLPEQGTRTISSVVASLTPRQVIHEKLTIFLIGRHSHSLDRTAPLRKKKKMVAKRSSGP